MGGGVGGLWETILDPVGIGKGLLSLGKPPKMPTLTPPPTVDPLKLASSLASSKKKAKDKSLAAYGQADTNLTQGLGALQPINKQYSTLLGSA